MQPSARQQELERLYNARRGHVPHISISDDNYHVTEALGSYYGDEGPPSPSSPTASNDRRDNRPLSFLPTAAESFENSTADGSAARKSRRNGSYFDMSKRAPLGRTQSNERLPAAAEEEDGAERNSLKRSGSRASEYSTGNGGGGAGGAGGGLTPGGESHTPPSTPPLNRSPSTDTAIQQFPLNDIDYESSPAAVAQELSNLQAIRRMSMNVDAADPDLPSFNAGGLVPTVAPKSSEDEDDAARLFWVPARLHPELAPKEFKTFIEDRVDKIRRRSGDAEALSPESPERSASDSSLRRKKSMLSHQIDTKGNYEDGAERLERKRSKGMSLEGQTRVDLSELETLVSDPSQLMRRMSLDTSRRSLDSGVEMTEGEDMPILPPVGQSLKRSTRTTYRKGSLKKGERMPYAKRVQQRQTEQDAEETSPRRTSFSAAEDSEPILGLTRVNTEPSLPAPSPSASREDFPPRQSSISQRRGEAESPRSSDDLSQSRPSQDRPPSQDDRFQQRSPPASQDEDRQAAPPHAAAPTGPPRPQHRQFQSRLASGPGRTTAQLPGYNNTNPLPHIIETLPDGTKVPAGSLISQIAERRASLDGPERKRSGELGRPFHQRGGAHMRPVPQQTNRGELPRSSTLDDLSSHPMLLPGSGGIGTDSLTLVPTYDEKKYEKKESSSSSSSSRKSTWKWVFGGDNDEEKRAAREEKAGSGSDSSSGIRSSLKSSRSNRQQQAQQQQQLQLQQQQQQLQQQQQQLQQQQQQPTEKARLDVLQNSIDGNVPPRGRESLVLNREDIKLDDDQQQQQQQQQRKKDPKRSSESKKDKDSSLLSAIFGVKKKSSSDSDVSKDKRRASRIDRGGGGRDGGAPVSPEPVLRILKPDIDYNWTRFSILEERAIYRMAHIKLANPRRALYSQVLLSNFMYSYLAKVQMMHPQVQIPAAHQRNHQRGQQKQDEQQQQQQQPAEFSQYQRWQQQQEREEAAAAASSSSGSNATAPPNAGLQQNSSSSSAFDASAAAPAEYDHDDFSSPTALGYELSRSNSEAYDHDPLSSSSSLSNQQKQQQQSYQSTSPSSSPTKTSFGLGGGGGGDGTAAASAAAYSVAGTHDYLGYPKESQPFDSSSPPSSQRGLWEDEDGVEETEASLW